MLSKELKSWKTLWDLFISDPEFRKYFTNTSGDYKITSRSVKPILEPSGTLLLPGSRRSGEDHFVAYTMTPQRITVFDPSDTSGTYGSYLNENTKRKISQLAKKPLYVNHRHPQCHSGDTFCQTWSLAWLSRNLSNYISESRTPNSSAGPIARLVKTVARSNRFINYMHFNEQTFQSLITRERNNKKLPSMTVDQFIHMSQHITPLQIRAILGAHKP